MFPMTKFYDLATHYDLTTRDIANSFKFLDELDAKFKSDDKDLRVQITDNDIVLSIDVPGVRPEDLNVSVLGRELTIQGKLREKSFVKKYSLSKNFDLTTAQATHEYGVLTLRFSKASELKPKTIQIKVNS